MFCRETYSNESLGWKMKKTFWAFIVIFFIFANNVPAKSFNADQINGIWISKTYLSVLKESLSFKTAFYSCNYQVLIYNPKNKELTVAINFFHEIESVKIKSIDPNSGAFVFNGPSSILKSLVFNDHILIAEFKNQNADITKQEYNRVSSQWVDYDNQINKFIVKEVFVGRYSDEKNSQIVFSEEIATWNGKKFKYEPILDYVEFIPIDAFAEVDSKGLRVNFYGFVTNGAMFQIYKLDENVKVIETLLFDLEKIQ
jgi:hypothetical protein